MNSFGVVSASFKDFCAIRTHFGDTFFNNSKSTPATQWTPPLFTLHHLIKFKKGELQRILECNISTSMKQNESEEGKHKFYPFGLVQHVVL